MEFAANRPLALSYHGHCSDLGFAAGLLGYDEAHEGVRSALGDVAQSGISLHFMVVDYPAQHDNEYRITADGLELTAVSTGGGMMEITRMGDVPISILGDSYEVLILGDTTQENPAVIMQELGLTDLYNRITIHEMNDKWVINIKSLNKLPAAVFRVVQANHASLSILCASPILPTRAINGGQPLFENMIGGVRLASRSEETLSELGIRYESLRAGLKRSAIEDQMNALYHVMAASLAKGLSGTNYQDRILPQQVNLIRDNQSKLVPSPIVNDIIRNVTAIMEAKSAMETFVAAPTAGSCGTLFGTLSSVCEDPSARIRGLFAAGYIGVLIADHWTFSAEMGGCQVECGAASAMTAAAIVDIYGGSSQQSLNAASMALQNMLGLICDPVAERVEVPCLGKNIMAGINALSVANMILAGYDSVIPLDETITALKEVSENMDLKYRCTCLGGLALTPTAQRLFNDLNKGE